MPFVVCPLVICATYRVLVGWLPVLDSRLDLILTRLDDSTIRFDDLISHSQIRQICVYIYILSDSQIVTTYEVDLVSFTFAHAWFVWLGLTETDRQRQTERERDREREGQRDRQTDTKTRRQTDRQTDTDTDIHRHRHRYRHRQKDSGSIECKVKRKTQALPWSPLSLLLGLGKLFCLVLVRV